MKGGGVKDAVCRQLVRVYTASRSSTARPMNAVGPRPFAAYAQRTVHGCNDPLRVLEKLMNTPSAARVYRVHVRVSRR